MSNRYALPSALRGLSELQRTIVKLHFKALGVERSVHVGNRKQGDSPYEGWTVYRAPTTINPPTELLLNKRGPTGRLEQSIVITRGGWTHVPVEFRHETPT